ncbi:hypothetical protein ACFC1T_16915 [Kitasatospora sp. NPDC056076]|uniref:hypothetical protein n=1 Tax=Kitasatospora sp. NPDC056076 TaxID=3345703 RepID=UPI0035D72588
MRHRVTVEAYLGDSAYGPRYGPPQPGIRCFLDDQTRLVRAKDGREVTSTSTAYCLPGAVVPAGSRVTLPSGRQTTVIATLTRDGGGLPTPDHVEVQLV